MKKEIKNRCQYSKEGLETFGKQRRGYVVGEGRDGGVRVLWDNLKTPQVYAEDFIEVNPLIELYTDEDGVEKEKPIEEADGKAYEITPEVIKNIEEALLSIKKTGIGERAIIVLIKDYVGAKVGISEIKEVVNAIQKLKKHYFNLPPTRGDNPH